MLQIYTPPTLTAAHSSVKFMTAPYTELITLLLCIIIMGLQARLIPYLLLPVHPHGTTGRQMMLQIHSDRPLILATPLLLMILLLYHLHRINRHVIIRHCGWVRRGTVNGIWVVPMMRQAMVPMKTGSQPLP